MTNYEYHQLTIIYEEATSRLRNSPGAWHIQLIAFIKSLGYDVSGYDQALKIAKELLKKNCL